MPMTSQMIQQEPNVRVRLLTAEIGILWRHIYETLMPAVVTARNTSGSHKNSATGSFGETEMCCGD